MAYDSNDREEMLLRACTEGNVENFREAAQGCDINQGLTFLCRRLGLCGLHLTERTPLMVAIFSRNINVVREILNTPGVHVNRRSATDNLTAMGCAEVYGSPPEIIQMLEESNAQRGGFAASSNINLNTIEHDPDPDPDVTGWPYQTEFFMMYKFKMRPCPWRDLCVGWVRCPYLHDQERYRRRDFRNHQYSSIRCHYFPSCRDSSCKFSHGKYETIFHPQVFRTRLCPDAMRCTIPVCTFAHNQLELRNPIPSPPPIPLRYHSFPANPHPVPFLAQPHSFPTNPHPVPILAQPYSIPTNPPPVPLLAQPHSSPANPPPVPFPRKIEQNKRNILLNPASHGEIQPDYFSIDWSNRPTDGRQQLPTIKSSAMNQPGN